MSGAKDWAAIKQAHAALLELHPELFSLTNPVPFKIGFHKDLKAKYPEMKWIIAVNLTRWLTKRRAYLAACKPGMARYGFDGPDGEVTPKHAEFAAAKFTARNETAFDKWATP